MPLGLTHGWQNKTGKQHIYGNPEIVDHLKWALCPNTWLGTTGHANNNDDTV